MTPLCVDLPHQLGAAEARRRIETGIGGLASHLPSGASVQPRWTGNRLDLAIALMGQDIKATLDVRKTIVRVEVVLPPALSFFRPIIEAGIRSGGAQMLEDHDKTRR